MARIYNQEQYEGSFSPRQQSRGFQAVQAVDNTSKERQRMQQELRDIDTQTKSLTRQQGLDSGILKAQQGIQRANMQARNAAVNGLLSLSKTAVSTMGKTTPLWVIELCITVQVARMTITPLLVMRLSMESVLEIITPLLVINLEMVSQQDTETY